MRGPVGRTNDTPGTLFLHTGRARGYRGEGAQAQLFLSLKIPQNTRSRPIYFDAFTSDEH